MYRQPYRPSESQITQNYNDGIVTIYRVTDSAEPGHKPVQKLQEKIVLRYEERRLGIQRYYAGQQNQVEIQRVIRTQRSSAVSNQDVAVTEDGRQYGINMVQMTEGVYPPSMDITLAKIEQKYEVENDLV